MSELKHTLSPSMDIMVSSNFERYLFDLFGRDGEALSQFMSNSTTGSQSVSAERWEQAKKVFSSAAVDDHVTCDVIKQVFAESEFLIDPHTAVGVKAARDCNTDTSVPMITLATAHPVKFSDAVARAGLDTPQLPEHLSDLFEREERYDIVDNSLGAITDYVKSHL